MDKVLSHSQMVINMLVSFKTILKMCMCMGHKTGKMALNIFVNLKTVKKMGKGFIHGKMIRKAMRNWRRSGCQIRLGIGNRWKKRKK